MCCRGPPRLLSGAAVGSSAGGRVLTAAGTSLSKHLLGPGCRYSFASRSGIGPGRWPVRVSSTCGPPEPGRSGSRAAPALLVVRSGHLDRDDRRACLRGDGGVSAEDGERSPDCRIVRSQSRPRVGAVSQIVNGGRACRAQPLKVILVLPRPPPGEGQDSLPGVWAVSWIRHAKARPGADGASRSTCGCPAPDPSGRGPTRDGQSVSAA